jgi:hypothetical protein
MVEVKDDGGMDKSRGRDGQKVRGSEHTLVVESRAR